MDTDRDLDKHPYSPDEMRVVKWLDERTGIGGGSDPIGFLIASHEYIAWEREQYRQAIVDHEIKINPASETAHLLKSAANASDLMRAIKDLNDGKGVEHELIPADPINANDVLAELPPERRAEVLECGRQLIAEERAAKVRDFDVAEYLDSPEAIAAYLNEAFETGDDDLIAQTLGNVARVQSTMA